MVYVFKMVSDEADGFLRTFEIDSDASFLDLRNLILESVGYDKSGIDSFFICERDWSRMQEITLEDMGTSTDMDSYLMKSTVIGDVVEDEGQRLVFVFDYLTDRSFFMELKDTMPGQHCEPRCVKSIGQPPMQSIDLDEFDKSLDASSDASIFDDDFADGGYNDDDFVGLDNIDESQL